MLHYFFCLLVSSTYINTLKRFGYAALICLLVYASVGFTQHSYAQGSSTNAVYQTNTTREIGLLLAGGIGSGVAYSLHHNKPTLTQQQIAALHPNSVFWVDRFIVAQQYYSTQAATLSDYLFIGSALLPLSLLASKSIRQDADLISLIGIETLLINTALTGLTKGSANRIRPYAYNPSVSYAQKNTTNTRASFFSGHTSTTAAVAFMSAKIYNDYYPNSSFGPYAYVIAAVLPAITGWLRIKAGKHFLTDVLVGYVVGGSVGILIPHLHQVH